MVVADKKKEACSVSGRIREKSETMKRNEVQKN